MTLLSLPSQDGFRMPAEFSRQDGVLLVWPVRPGSWGVDPGAAQKAFCEIMRACSRSERVYLLADTAHLSEATIAAGEFATIIEIETNDAWARDIGPTFVSNGQEARGISWRFNAWGGAVDGLYADWQKDDAAAEAFCHAINAALLRRGRICARRRFYLHRRRRDAACHRGMPTQRGAKPADDQGGNRTKAKGLSRRGEDSLAAERNLSRRNQRARG